MPDQPTKCTLKPGETCLFCGSIGKKKEPKRPPNCDLCGQDFHRNRGAWRLYRGRRRHVRCMDAIKAAAPVTAADSAGSRAAREATDPPDNEPPGPSVAEQIAEVKSGKPPKDGIIPALVDAAVKLATAPRRRMKRKPRKGAK